jgi:hypothetical protein
MLLNDLKDESAVQDVILADNYAMAKSQLDQMGSKAKSKEAQAKYLAARGELDMKISELYGSAAEKAAKAAAQKLPTGDQSKAAGFARRIEQAEGIFSDLTNKGYDRSSVGSALASQTFDVAKGSYTKQQEQAERNFVNAVLRRESGAASAESDVQANGNRSHDSFRESSGCSGNGLPEAGRFNPINHKGRVRKHQEADVTTSTKAKGDDMNWLKASPILLLIGAVILIAPHIGGNLPGPAPHIDDVLSKAYAADRVSQIAVLRELALQPFDGGTDEGRRLAGEWFTANRFKNRPADYTPFTDAVAEAIAGNSEDKLADRLEGKR